MADDKPEGFLAAVGEATGSLFEAIGKRISNPFFWAFAGSWLVWNWRTVVTLFFDDFSHRLDKIADLYRLPSGSSALVTYLWELIHSMWVITIFGPLITALIYLFAMPFVSRWFRGYEHAREIGTQDHLRAIELEERLSSKAEVQAKLDAQAKQLNEQMEAMKSAVAGANLAEQQAKTVSETHLRVRIVMEGEYEIWKMREALKIYEERAVLRQPLPLPKIPWRVSNPSTFGFQPGSSAGEMLEHVGITSEMLRSLFVLQGGTHSLGEYMELFGRTGFDLRMPELTTLERYGLVEFEWNGTHDPLVRMTSDGRCLVSNIATAPELGAHWEALKARRDSRLGDALTPTTLTTTLSS